MIDAKLAEKQISLIDRIIIYGRMIKFSHTIFALPFALSAAILAHRTDPVTASEIFWILVAMVGARSAAMGFNRIADERFDRKNPRTANREIPSGQLPKSSAIAFVGGFSALFVFAAFMLGKTCFYLSVPVLAVLLGYSYTKRFTWLCHVYLGLAISLAPLGTWVALTDSLSMPVVYLSLALLTHIAGFDILYACQDMAFDTQEGLYSIPSRLGLVPALIISAVIHAMSFFFFFMVYRSFEMGPVFLCAVVIIGILLVIEHLLVNPRDLSKVHIAFFYINSVVSAVLLLGVFLDVFIKI